MKRLAKTNTIKFKKILNLVLGVPSGLAIVCEPKDMTSVTIQFLALFAIVGLLYFNGAFEEKEYQW